MFNKNICAVPCQAKGAETAEEIIGVLTAISVISKRMAKKLALMEQTVAQKEGAKINGKSRRLSGNGD